MYPDRDALALLMALAYADTQVPVIILRPRGTDLGLLPPVYRDRQVNNRPPGIPVTAEHITCLGSHRKSKKRTAFRIARDKKNRTARKDRKKNR